MAKRRLLLNENQVKTGNLIAGSNITISGNITDRLITNPH